MKCPKCSAALEAERYESVQIDRCRKCQGTWLDEGELLTILQTKEAQFSSALIKQAIHHAFAGLEKQEPGPSRMCPKCAEGMQTVNYGYDSGIVIDRCPGAHGVWLDGQELEKLQARHEHWERETDANRAEWLKLLKKAEQNPGGGSGPRSAAPGGYLLGIIRKLLGF
ncbi:MAG: zf-TFIIB domain-containing protein [Oligoflexia bacterium]|nr:zf-TFIIB domain-containing protein [Oligoflexia bacterium]